MEADIRKLSRRRAGSASDDDDDGRPAKKAREGPSHLEQELSRYANNRAVVRRDKEGKKLGRNEGDLLAALDAFRGKLQKAQPGDDDDDNMEEQAKLVDPIDARAVLPDAEEEGIEVDDDLGWLGHQLKFHHGNEEETTKADRDYEVIDPRVRGEKARGEERDRKKQSDRKRERGVGQAFRRR